MSKIIIKLLSNLIPSKRIRHYIREYFGLKLNSEQLIEYSIQPFFLKKHSEKKLFAQRLILGSSHAMRGLAEQDKELNLGTSSQDLYYSYQLYKLFAPQMCNLKQVVLFFSVFSNGFNLGKCSEYCRCVPLKLFFGIPYENEKELKKKAVKAAEKQIKQNIQIISTQANTFQHDDNYIDMSSELVQYVAEKHKKHNKRQPHPLKYLKMLIEDSKKNGHTLIIVIPPYRNDYKSLLESSDILFAQINNIVQNNPHIRLLNFYDDVDFESRDFLDCDHLKFSTGAKKLRNKLNKTDFAKL